MMSDKSSEDSDISIPPEVPEADRLEQARGDDEANVSRNIRRPRLADEEASEADVLDQSAEVPYDEDSYR